jgi:hypothetical protein
MAAHRLLHGNFSRRSALSQQLGSHRGHDVSLIRTFMLVASVAVCLNLAHTPAYAVTPEQIVRELIGAPVYASD